MVTAQNWIILSNALSLIKCSMVWAARNDAVYHISPLLYAENFVSYSGPDNECSVFFFSRQTPLNMRQVSLCFQERFFHSQSSFPSTLAKSTLPAKSLAFSASEGCNLLATSAMTLVLLPNSWLSCGVTWVSATNLAEPQTLKRHASDKGDHDLFHSQSTELSHSGRMRVQDDHVNIQATISTWLHIIWRRVT